MITNTIQTEPVIDYIYGNIRPAETCEKPGCLEILHFVRNKWQFIGHCKNWQSMCIFYNSDHRPTYPVRFVSKPSNKIILASEDKYGIY